MRTDVELLQVMKVNFNTHFFSGLCLLTGSLHESDLITVDERVRLLTIIGKNRPTKYWHTPKVNSKTSLYYWKAYTEKPRLKWINKMIKKYDNN